MQLEEMPQMLELKAAGFVDVTKWTKVKPVPLHIAAPFFIRSLEYNCLSDQGEAVLAQELWVGRPFAISS